jgi:tight adherence protein B
MLAIHVLKPEFYGSVWHEPIIKYGFLGLGTWMFIGNMVMRKMINFKM